MVEENENNQNEVIETDFDTREADSDTTGSLYPYDPAFTDIEITDSPFTIFDYLRQLKKGRVIIQPDFQRNQIWNIKQKSKFIESIILNFPLPPIYLNETQESQFIVIDGLQRTTALQQFYDDEYSLTGIEALPKYNGCRFNDLLPALQSKFEDKKLTVFILKPSTPMVVIYDLFNRINTGGTQLNRQEVRNCIFIGKSTKLLKELSEEEYFKQAIDWGVKPSRMKDREVVLRYLSFRWFNFTDTYNGDMSEFVEIAMKQVNKLPDDKINEMKKDFKRVMEWSFSIWQEENFRIPTEFTRGTINTAILESVGRYISFRTDDFLTRNKFIIRENYKQLIENKRYLEAVTRSTGSKAKVLDRFRMAEEILETNTQ